MALEAGEPLLCDRPIGQHAVVPSALSLVDKRVSYDQPIGGRLRSGNHEMS